MRLTFLKSKIHRATVTEANLHYEGSITLGQELMDAARISNFERVEIYNITRGDRFSTYAIPGPSRTVCINGAAAWKASRGDIIIIATYCELEESEFTVHKPTLVYVNSQNEITRVVSGGEAFP